MPVNEILANIKWDETLYIEIVNNVPTVLAHEYWRLFEQCKKQNIYGTLFEIKDVLEITLKFETLLICSWAKTTCQPSYTTDLEQLLVDKLALGSWLAFAQQLKKALKKADVPNCLWKPFTNIIDVFNQGNMVNWRNQYIGHGATRMEDDPELYKQISDKIECINQFYKKNLEYIKKQVILLDGIKLSGYEFPAIFNSLTAQNLELQLEDQTIQLSPYMHTINDALENKFKQNRGIFVYDGFNKRSLESELLTYATGHRKTLLIQHFRDLCANDHKKEDKNKESIIGSENMTAEDAIALHDIQTGNTLNRFLPPLYLMEWLNKQVSKYSKGVFHIEMERGTGKSTFASKLSLLDSNPLVIDDSLDVRTYHCNRTYGWINEESDKSIDSAFEKEMTLQWAYEKDESKRRIQPFSFPDGDKNSVRLSCFLSEVLAFTKNKRNKDSLMLVIDGLDEVTDNATIFSYLPTQELLDEGIYILILYRKVDDVKNNGTTLNQIKKQIKEVYRDEILSLERHQDLYVDFLKSYIEATNVIAFVDGNGNETVVEKMLQRSDYRILQLNMLLYIYPFAVARNIDILDSENSFLSSYLNVLEIAYGDKEFEHVKELLLIIANFGDILPLTIAEISELSWYRGEVTLDLLGKLRDIEPLLNIERGYFINNKLINGENTFSFSNEDIRSQLLQILKGDNYFVEEIIRNMFALIQNCQLSHITVNNPTLTAVLVVACHRIHEYRMQRDEYTSKHEKKNKDRIAMESTQIVSFLDSIMNNLTIRQMSLVEKILRDIIQIELYYKQMPNDMVKKAALNYNSVTKLLHDDFLAYLHTALVAKYFLEKEEALHFLEMEYLSYTILYENSGVIKFKSRDEIISNIVFIKEKIDELYKNGIDEFVNLKAQTDFKQAEYNYENSKMSEYGYLSLICARLLFHEGFQAVNKATISDNQISHAYIQLGNVYSNFFKYVDITSNLLTKKIYRLVAEKAYQVALTTLEHRKETIQINDIIALLSIKRGMLKSLEVNRRNRNKILSLITEIKDMITESDALNSLAYTSEIADEYSCIAIKLRELGDIMKSNGYNEIALEDCKISCQYYKTIIEIGEMGDEQMLSFADLLLTFPQMVKEYKAESSLVLERITLMCIAGKISHDNYIDIKTRFEELLNYSLRDEQPVLFRKYRNWRKKQEKRQKEYYSKTFFLRNTPFLLLLLGIILSGIYLVSNNASGLLLALCITSTIVILSTAICAKTIGKKDTNDSKKDIFILPKLIKYKTWLTRGFTTGIHSLIGFACTLMLLIPVKQYDSKLAERFTVSGVLELESVLILLLCLFVIIGLIYFFIGGPTLIELYLLVLAYIDVRKKHSRLRKDKSVKKSKDNC